MLRVMSNRECSIVTTRKIVTFIFIPEHTDIMGNERVDRLAGWLCHYIKGQPMYCAEVKNTLWEAGQKQHMQLKKSASKVRVQAFGLKTNVIRKENHIKCERRLYQTTLEGHNYADGFRRSTSSVSGGLSDKIGWAWLVIVCWWIYYEGEWYSELKWSELSHHYWGL